MIFRNSHSLIRVTAFCLTALAVSSCDQIKGFFNPPPHPLAKHIVAPKKHYDASLFVENMSMARLALLGGATADDVADNIGVMESYSEQKKQKPVQLTLIIMEYQQKSGGLQTIMAPLGKSDFPALSNILGKWSAAPHSLQNVHVVNATLAPPGLLPFSDLNAAQLLDALNSQQQKLLQGAEKLPLLDDVKMQLALLHYFIDQHRQDAAYLSLDNIKREMAKGEHTGSLDVPTVRQLSQELETLETRLYHEMPYTL